MIMIMTITNAAHPAMMPASAPSDRRVPPRAPVSGSPFVGVGVCPEGVVSGGSTEKRGKLIGYCAQGLIETLPKIPVSACSLIE